MEASCRVERPAAAEAKAPEVPANPAGEGGEDMESHEAVGGTLGVSVSSSVMGFLSGRGFLAAGSASAGAGENRSDAAGTIDSDAAPKVGQFGVNELGSWVGRRTSCLDDTARGSDARELGSNDNTPGAAEEDAARGLGRFGLGQFGPCVDMQSSNQDAGESGSSSTTSTSTSDGDRSRSSAQWRKNIGYPVHDSMGLRSGSRGVVPGEGRNVRDRRGYGNDRSMLGGSTTSGSTMSRFRSFGDGSTCSSSSWNSSWNSSQWEGSTTSGKSNTYGFPSFPRENCPEGGLYGGVPRFNSSRNRIHSAIADGGGFTRGGGGRGRGRADNEGSVSPKPDIVWGVTGSKRLPASSSAVASGGKRGTATALRDLQPVHDSGGGGGRVTRQAPPPGEAKAPGVDRDREDLEVFGTGARRGGDKNGEGGTRGGGGGGGGGDGSGSGVGGSEEDEEGGSNFLSFGSGSNAGRRRGGRSDKWTNGATPPRSRRRPPAVREFVGPHCAATPAAAAALEADILNQVPRPPRPLPRARPSAATVGDGAHVKATPFAATTQSAAAAVAETATASASSPPPRGSFTVGVENSRRWLLSRGAASERVEAGGSKKIGPRHLSCDPHIANLTGNGATADSSPSDSGVVEATVSVATGTSMRGQEGERDDGGEGGVPVEVGTASARAPRAVPLVARATHVAVLESDGRIGGIREMAVDGKFREVSGTAGAAAFPTAFIWKGEGRQAVSFFCFCPTLFVSGVM